MKYIAIIALMMIAGAAMAQSGSILWRYNKQIEGCGTWIKDSMRYTDWVTVDTISSEKVNTEKRDWVYDKEREVNDYITYDVYYPCGFEPGEKWRQYRICRITGIKQERYRVQEYTYIPPRLSDYGKAEDSLLDKAGRKLKIFIAGDSTVIRKLFIKPSIGNQATLEYKLFNQ